MSRAGGQDRALSTTTPPTSTSHTPPRPTVLALNPADGSQAWSLRLPNTPAPLSLGAFNASAPSNVSSVFVSPLADDHIVYVKDDANVLRAVHHDNGTVLWSVRVGKPSYTVPAHGTGASASVVYVAAVVEQELFALNCPAGSQFVVDRLTYRCEDLGIMVPTQRDLCEELGHRCPDPR